MQLLFINALQMRTLLLMRKCKKYSVVRRSQKWEVETENIEKESLIVAVFLHNFLL